MSFAKASEMREELERYKIEAALERAMTDEFFCGREPEKLPPLSGPVTMADGTVLVPHDSVNHPSHYAANGPTCPHCGSTIECITITEGMGFCLGNTFKYIWRKDSKGNALEDLKKARWYLDREIQRMEGEVQG